MKIQINNIVFCIMLVLLSFLAGACSVGLYRMTYMPQADFSGDYIDGTDISPWLNLGLSAVSGAVSLITAIGYGLIILIVSLIFSLILLLICFRKKYIFSITYRTTIYIYGVNVAFSLFLSLIATHFTQIAYSFTYTIIWALAVFLIYLLPLTVRRKKLSVEQT